MAQITFDTDSPADVKLMQSLLDAGLMGGFTNGNGHVKVDMSEVIDALLSRVGDEARELIQEFAVQTVKSPTTLEDVAKAMKVDYSTVKARKLGLGRTVKKIQRQFPGVQDPIQSKWDALEKKTIYTMESTVRVAIDKWFVDHGYE